MNIEIRGRKILLIGNGFDLAHGLPTSYSYFLDFCDKVEKKFNFQSGINEKGYKTNELNDWNIDDSIKSKLYEWDKNTNNNLNKLFIEIYDNIKDNIWINYFLNIRYTLGKNWIDFESEISNIIQAFECIRDNIERRERIQQGEGSKVIKLEVVKGFVNISTEIEGLKELDLEDMYTNLKLFDVYIKKMTVDLDKLIRALEIYISEFINKIEVLQKNDDIKDINPDCVLSFNYSNTYERIYGQSNKVEYDYIHGKADKTNNVNTCNLVLGIDEYLEECDRDNKLEFLPFKKFYQRIFKSTDSSYMEWVDEIRQNSNYPYELYIFGHSLDKTDKDVLELLICNDNVQTKIYYHRKSNDDKKELGKLIRNLVRVIGSKELIRRTGGSHKTIEFIPQNISTEIEGLKELDLEDMYTNLKLFDVYIKKMTVDLDKLIRALEIYISEFINKIEVLQKNDDIKDINPDCVLSFNYSNTYERIYGQSNKVEYDYIHGKADKTNNVNTCNLVLGIDEYLEECDRDNKLEFLPFKKFYQRIFKSTDSSYMEWVDEIRQNSNYPYELYIFGHSLDKTDKDVLELLICNDNVQTKIYYHRKSNDDKKELGKLIRNLVRVIGSKELIRRTGGSHKTIEFIPQTLPEAD